jgi:hypothetical protein
VNIDFNRNLASDHQSPHPDHTIGAIAMDPTDEVGVHRGLLGGPSGESTTLTKPNIGRAGTMSGVMANNEKSGVVACFVIERGT